MQIYLLELFIRYCYRRITIFLPSSFVGHTRVCHSGVKDTLTEIRSAYWIPQGRSFVHKFVGHCVIFRRYSGPSYKPPPPPPLPKYRVQEDFPFMSVGVDYAGPLTVKHYAHSSYPKALTSGKPNAHISYSGKVCVCVFTCVSRAVHFEIVTDLTPLSFIRCFKRFVSKRGLPARIISDNGTTFKAAAKTIRNVFKHPKVQNYLSGVNVKWIFNIERAPWWGGFFECMVQLLKRCLRKMVGQAKLTYEEFLTSVTEVELILNSRPLTYMSATDLEEPLTPTHLINGRCLLTLPDHLCYLESDVDFSPSAKFTLNRRMKHLHSILDHFWRRWKKEYLLELRENHRYSSGKTQDQVSVGDVVIIHDDLPRGMWRLGVITEKIKGEDNAVRGAIVRIKSGRGPASFLRRPVQKLYPLEVKQREFNTQEY